MATNPSATAPSTFDLIVIGAGPGGYVAAIRAAQLGRKVAVVEKEPSLGGTCLRVGCIPSKALLESSERFEEARHSLKQHGVLVADVGLDLATMMRRKDLVVAALTKGVEALLRKNQITRFVGHGSIPAPGQVLVTPTKGDSILLAGASILVATGSQPVALPGVEFDQDRIGTSTEALSYPSVPSHLVVAGAGYIGLELGSVWRRLGAKVTVIEYLDRILPGMDSEIASEAKRLFERQGIEFRLKTKVSGAQGKDGRCTLRLNEDEILDCDRLLVAVGRRPNLDGLGLEALGVTLDDRRRIVVDRQFATNIRGIYAIGDVIAGPMLAHKAEEEGIAFAEGLATGHAHIDYRFIPGIVYTHPEIATVGRSEDELAAASVAYTKGVFPFQANGRARAMGSTDGRVKILAAADTDVVLGVHIIGPRAGDLIAEAAAAMALGASSEDVARICHAHPTLSEALREAALAVDGRAIHA